MRQLSRDIATSTSRQRRLQSIIRQRIQQFERDAMIDLPRLDELFEHLILRTDRVERAKVYCETCCLTRVTE
jgi:tRNA U55 pseudouridine synthase TruB